MFTEYYVSMKELESCMRGEKFNHAESRREYIYGGKKCVKMMWSKIQFAKKWINLFEQRVINFQRILMFFSIVSILFTKTVNEFNRKWKFLGKLKKIIFAKQIFFLNLSILWFSSKLFYSYPSLLESTYVSSLLY